MTDVHRPRLGDPGAPCRSCGAPLAADQRYCLQCGSRRAEARLAFLEILERRAAAAPAPVGAPTRHGLTGVLAGLSTNAAAVAGVACLLLALGVGVLIGDHRGGGAAAAPSPAITVSAGAPATAAATPATTATTPATAQATTPAKTAKPGARSSSASARAQSRATNPTVAKLQGATGSDYAKQSAKLPKTVGTGGRAPPKDEKPAAGGGSFEEIG